jgi:hypothetical protein
MSPMLVGPGLAFDVSLVLGASLAMSIGQDRLPRLREVAHPGSRKLSWFPLMVLAVLAAASCWMAIMHPLEFAAAFRIEMLDP